MTDLDFSEWPIVSLKDVTTKVGSGATPRGGKEVYRDAGTAFIRSQNVRDNQFSFDGLARISDHAAQALRGVEVRSGDVLINITGESVTRTALVPDSALPARVSQHVAIVRPDPAVLDSRFLLATLLNPPTKAHLNTLSEAGATRRALTKTHIERTRISLPSLEEQRRIAGVLGALDNLIDTNRQLARALEDQLLALFAAESFDAAPGQNAITLGGLVEVNPKLEKPSVEAAYVDMAALPTDSSRIGSVVRRAPTGGSRFQNSDTLLARLTPCLENGKAAFVDVLDGDEIAIGSTEFLVLRDRGAVGSHWPYVLTRSQRFREYAIANMNGSSGRQRVSADAIANYPMATPDPGALKRFRATASVTFSVLRELNEETADLTRARDELLPLLISGRVRVSERLAVA